MDAFRGAAVKNIQNAKKYNIPITREEILFDSIASGQLKSVEEYSFTDEGEAAGENVVLASTNIEQDRDLGEQTDSDANEGQHSATSSEIIDCICGDNIDIGLMIQCDRCFRWVHAPCVDIKKNNVPDIYTCPTCVDEEQHRKFQFYYNSPFIEGHHPISQADDGTNGTVFSDSDCGICLLDLMDGEIIYSLEACSHTFHLECVYRCLRSRYIQDHCVKCMTPIDACEERKITKLSLCAKREKRYEKRQLQSSAIEEACHSSQEPMPDQIHQETMNNGENAELGDQEEPVGSSIVQQELPNDQSSSDVPENTQSRDNDCTSNQRNDNPGSDVMLTPISALAGDMEHIESPGHTTEITDTERDSRKRSHQEISPDPIVEPVLCTHDVLSQFDGTLAIDSTSDEALSAGKRKRKDKDEANETLILDDSGSATVSMPQLSQNLVKLQENRADLLLHESESQEYSKPMIMQESRKRHIPAPLSISNKRARCSQEIQEVDSQYLLNEEQDQVVEGHRDTEMDLCTQLIDKIDGLNQRPPTQTMDHRFAEYQSQHSQLIDSDVQHGASVADGMRHISVSKLSAQCHEQQLSFEDDSSEANDILENIVQDMQIRQKQRGITENMEDVPIRIDDDDHVEQEQECSGESQPHEHVIKAFKSKTLEEQLRDLEDDLFHPEHNHHHSSPLSFSFTGNSSLHSDMYPSQNFTDSETQITTDCSQLEADYVRCLHVEQQEELEERKSWLSVALADIEIVTLR